jgi:hypothetical protein
VLDAQAAVDYDAPDAVFGQQVAERQQTEAAYIRGDEHQWLADNEAEAG